MQRRSLPSGKILAKETILNHFVLEIEGIWEEIAARAPELTGRRVRLTVLQETTAPKPPEEALCAEHPLLRHVGT